MKHTMIELEQWEGLYQCTTCLASEGEVPTECPGRKMSPEEKQDVFEGKLNFKDGKWIKLGEEQLWMVCLDDSYQVTETIVHHSCRQQLCDCGPELICRTETPELAKQIVEEHNNAIARNDKHSKG